MQNNDNIGERIKELRKLHKFSQEYIGDIVGVHFSHISRIESGKLCPSFKLVKKIFKALGYKLYAIQEV